METIESSILITCTVLLIISVISIIYNFYLSDKITSLKYEIELKDLTIDNKDFINDIYEIRIKNTTKLLKDLNKEIEDLKLSKNAELSKKDKEIEDLKNKEILSNKWYPTIRTQNDTIIRLQYAIKTANNLEGVYKDEIRKLQSKIKRQDAKIERLESIEKSNIKSNKTRKTINK